MKGKERGRYHFHHPQTENHQIAASYFDGMMALRGLNYSSSFPANINTSMLQGRLKNVNFAKTKLIYLTTGDAQLEISNYHPTPHGHALPQPTPLCLLTLLTVSRPLTLKSQPLTASILNHPVKMTWWKRYVTQSWSEDYHDIQSYFCWLFFSLCTWRCGSIRYGKKNKLRVFHFRFYWLPTW